MNIFSVKITVKIKVKIWFVFSLFVKKRTFYEFSTKSIAQKVWIAVYSSEITVRTLTFRDRTAEISYCADVTLFLHTTSGGLPLTAAFLVFLHESRREGGSLIIVNKNINKCFVCFFSVRSNFISLMNSYSRKRIKHECSVRIENSVPRDYCFASLGTASWCQTVTLGTELSIRTSHPCKFY